VSSPLNNSVNINEAIAWFREASPYINEHRARTVVLYIPDRLLAGEQLPTLTHDLTLLSHLGMRLILCFGLRSDVNARLENDSVFHEGRRVTDDVALKTVIESAGVARCDLEARLSMGLPNTPMAGAHLSICSGNFVTARPYGIHDGVDFLHTGTVREVQTQALKSLLKAQHLILVPPIGHSLTGEVFNLPAEEVAVEISVAMEADKLVMFLPEIPKDEAGQIQREASASQIRLLAERIENKSLTRSFVRAAAASERGVPRVHLLPDNDPNALLREFFSVDGAGTLVTAQHFESLRPATIHDVGGLIELIEPLQRNGTLVPRSREQLELDIANFVVCEREGKVVACAALFMNGANAEIACLVTHPNYQGGGRAEKLLKFLESRAEQIGIKVLSIRTTRTAHWFVERGFTQASIDDLPETRRASYNTERNSQVFAKRL